MERHHGVRCAGTDFPQSHVGSRRLFRNTRPLSVPRLRLPFGIVRRALTHGSSAPRKRERALRKRST